MIYIYTSIYVNLLGAAISSTQRPTCTVAPHMYVHIYVCIHICIYINTYYLYVNIRMHIHKYIFTYTCINICTCVPAQCCHQQHPAPHSHRCPT